MPAATLTEASPTVTFDTVANTPAVIGTSGVWAGARLNLEYALTSAPAVFQAIPGGSFYGHDPKVITPPGSKLKATLIGATGATSINIELT